MRVANIMARKLKNANVNGVFNDDYILVVGNDVILDSKQFSNSVIRKSIFGLKKVLTVVLLFLSISVGAQTTISMEQESFFNNVLFFIEKGYSATIIVVGRSMTPFIYDGEKIRLEKNEKYKNGDIVLAHLPEGSYVLHRIVSLSDGWVTLMGDGNPVQREYCPVDSLKALCRVKLDEKHHIVPLDNDIQKSRIELWQACLSQREALLSSLSIPDDTFWEKLFLSCIRSNREIRVTIRPCEIMEINHEKYVISTGSSNVDSTGLISFNESAELLLKKMKGKDLCLDEVVEILLQEYDVDKMTATNDCLDLLTRLFSVGILKIIVD